MIEFKNELEALIEEQQAEMDDRVMKCEQMEDIIKQKEAEEPQQQSYIGNLEQQIRNMSSKNKAFELRLRKMKNGKMNEL